MTDPNNELKGMSIKCAHCGRGLMEREVCKCKDNNVDLDQEIKNALLIRSADKEYSWIFVKDLVPGIKSLIASAIREARREELEMLLDPAVEYVEKSTIAARLVALDSGEGEGQSPPAGS